MDISVNWDGYNRFSKKTLDDVSAENKSKVSLQLSRLLNFLAIVVVNLKKKDMARVNVLVWDFLDISSEMEKAGIAKPVISSFFIGAKEDVSVLTELVKWYEDKAK